MTWTNSNKKHCHPWKLREYIRYEHWQQTMAWSS